MISSKVKVLVAVFALLLFTGFVTAGCKEKTKNSWVNTASLPGQTFSHHGNANAKPANSRIVYLGSDSSKDAGFAPRDVSFEFQDLK